MLDVKVMEATLFLMPQFTEDHQQQAAYCWCVPPPEEYVVISISFDVLSILHRARISVKISVRAFSQNSCTGGVTKLLAPCGRLSLKKNNSVYFLGVFCLSPSSYFKSASFLHK